MLLPHESIAKSQCANISHYLLWVVACNKKKNYMQKIKVHRTFDNL